jgi:hypothetical protein
VVGYGCRWIKVYKVEKLEDENIDLAPKRSVAGRKQVVQMCCWGMQLSLYIHTYILSSCTYAHHFEHILSVGGRIQEDWRKGQRSCVCKCNAVVSGMLDDLAVCEKYLQPGKFRSCSNATSISPKMPHDETLEI